MSRRCRDAAGPPSTLPAQRTAVRMRLPRRHLGTRVNRFLVADEHVVDEVQPGARTLRKRLEHMFDNLVGRPDGMAAASAGYSAASARRLLPPNGPKSAATRGISGATRRMPREIGGRTTPAGVPRRTSACNESCRGRSSAAAAAAVHAGGQRGGLGCRGSYSPSSAPPGSRIAVTSPQRSSAMGRLNSTPFPRSSSTVPRMSSHIR